ncbi:hypothetical protein BGZ60DRAFT_381714 [Tricladium varicosporioides]|nr:hypothetical protein BGZ60DRAFT_381714 [Hymenoscyphus varicosporioides]
MRQLSHASSSSNSAASPKSRYSFFTKKKLSISGNLPQDASSDKIYNVNSQDSSCSTILIMPKPNHAEDKIPTSPFPDLEPTRSRSRSNGLPSPDPFVGAIHDTEYLHLKENIRRIRKLPPGPDVRKVDAVWETYKKVRDECLLLCQSLLQKSRKLENNGRSASIESTLDPLDTRSSYSGSMTETALPFHVNEQWLAAIKDYKSLQEQMLDNLRTAILVSYKKNEPEASAQQVKQFLDDIKVRKNLIAKWRDASIHAMKSEKTLYWEQLRIRSLNFDRLKLDLQAVEKLFGVADAGEAPDMAIREYVIAKQGDTILEFANKGADIYPILRFRVSSHLLAESSELFKQMLLPHQADTNNFLETQIPPSPTRITCKDGMEVKVYHMPQMELNENEALTILLHAAHMHREKVPRQIEYPVFVSIAEVCLRYRCTSPLEMQVEYQWIPQWQHMIGDDSPDGMLLISFAFGMRRIFTRMSKTAILNSLDDEEIDSKHLWPQAVRDKIKAIRSAKVAQIHECCTNAIEEYFRPPSEYAERRSNVGSLQFTTTPRCPRGSHQCDATNLGWLMLVYNELRILPGIMNKVGFRNLPVSPRRSLKEIVDSLRLMPSAPQVHPGVCDYAPAFRSAINDIYNSITGLTLRDITGRDGWALSKHAGPSEDRHENNPGDMAELEAPYKGRRSRREAAISNEDISFRILSYIDDLEHLTNAAMIDKSFYRAYKRNEASLLKNVVKAERRRTLSHVSPDLSSFRDSFKTNTVAPSRLNGSATVPESSKFLVTDKPKVEAPLRIDTSGGYNLYDASPTVSPYVSFSDDVPISAEEADRILSAHLNPQEITSNPRPGWHAPEATEKFLLEEVSHTGQKMRLKRGSATHIEDKARIIEDDKNKHLRHEKDMALGLSIHK